MVLDSIAKVDKSLRAAIPSSPVSAASSVRPPTGNARFICHACGIPGHTAPYCFRRRNRPVRGRFAPYQRASSARGSFQQKLRHRFFSLCVVSLPWRPPVCSNQIHCISLLINGLCSLNLLFRFIPWCFCPPTPSPPSPTPRSGLAAL